MVRTSYWTSPAGSRTGSQVQGRAASLVTQAGTTSPSSSALTTSWVIQYLHFTPAGVEAMGKLRD